ncbi:hypothetical protein LCM27_19745 [Ruegeria marisrubri]|uniref:hypothetical protein n=1 Tax=Ruegeria marisrubri TaxID=1685379 RepID=UPI001CD2517F|nr:hypothetical protein [Ruegeria marisrubri]MCA0908644.1 hypothetical protein [Ruegeria marisrubri]
MNDRKNIPKRGGIALAALAAAAVGALGTCFPRHDAPGHKAGRAGSPMRHRRTADGQGHNDVNTPGLRGRKTTPEESAKLAAMFRNFDTITRKVENLPDGIRTVTRSSDPRGMEAVHEMMMTRG